MERTDGNGDMERFIGGPTDDELEAVIQGSRSSDAVVTEFVVKLRAVAEQPPSDASMATHVAMAARAARRAAVPAGDAAAPVVPAEGPRRLSRLRRRVAYFGFTSGLAAKMLFGAVAVAAVTGGAAAATGNLPDSLQDTVASVADRVGINLPAADDAPDLVVAEGDDKTNNASDQGAEQQERAKAFAAAVDDWTNCVQEREADEDGRKENPHDACGDHPNPKDFGLPSEDNGQPAEPGKDSAPGQNKDEAPGNSGDAPGQNKNTDDAPGNSENRGGGNQGGGNQGGGQGGGNQGGDGGEDGG